MKFESKLSNLHRCRAGTSPMGTLACGKVQNMIIGTVMGSIFSTRKSEKLVGNKFMIVRPEKTMSGNGNDLIAIDIIGAGIGEKVLVAMGSAARIGCDMAEAPVDAAIVGIVDEGQDGMEVIS